MKLLPEIRDDDLIAGLQLIDIAEIRSTTPTSMASYDAIGIGTAQGDTGLGEQRCAVGHMLISGA